MSKRVTAGYRELDLRVVHHDLQRVCSSKRSLLPQRCAHAINENRRVIRGQDCEDTKRGRCAADLSRPVDQRHGDEQTKAGNDH